MQFGEQGLIRILMDGGKRYDQMSESEKRALYTLAQEPESQVMSASDEEEDGLEEVEPDDEGSGEDSAEIQVAVKRLERQAEKRPFNPQVWPEIEDPEILESNRKWLLQFQGNLKCNEVYPEGPDLAGYLGQFGLSSFRQISLCRTYANYLTQQDRAMKAELPKQITKKSKK